MADLQRGDQRPGMSFKRVQQKTPAGRPDKSEPTNPRQSGENGAKLKRDGGSRGTAGWKRAPHRHCLVIVTNTGSVHTRRLRSIISEVSQPFLSFPQP